MERTAATTTVKTLNFQSARSDNTSPENKGAFTLIELLIVIVLIGGIYALVAPPVDKIFKETKKTSFKPEQILEYLKKLSSENSNGAFRFECEKSIKECQITLDGKIIETGLKVEFGNSDDVKIKKYLPTPQGGLKEDTTSNTMFSLELSKNNVQKPFIYEVNSNIYVFSQNSESGKPLAEKSKAIQIYLNNDLLPMSQERILAN